KRLSPAAMQELVRFAFPGNVRQLENICHWLTVMAPSQTVDVRDLPPELRDGPAAAAALANTHVAAGGANLSFHDHEERAQPDATSARMEPDPYEPAPRDGARDSAREGGPAWLNGLQSDALDRLRSGETNIMHDMT